MIFAITTLISALSISLIAAYFSIIGLATIFPGSIYAVIAMGSVLEIGKIIASIWLHKNWKVAPRMIKIYLFFAILVLMGITSMGIFGFLSKSHIEHEQNAEKSKALVVQVENKIERKKDYIDRQKELIKQNEENSQNLGDKSSKNIKLEQEKIQQLTIQLDRDIEIDNKIISSLKERLAILDEDLNQIKNKSGGLFSSKKKDVEAKILDQKDERQSISEKMQEAESRISKHRDETSNLVSEIRKRIQEYQSIGFEDPSISVSKIENININIAKALEEIDQLEQEKFNYGDGTRQLEAEVGPVKYVAEVIADFTGAEFDLGKAVRIVIVILIFVFDPLAILLVLAAHISLSKRFPKSMIDEGMYLEKIAEMEIKEKEIESKEFELEERKKDIDEDRKIIKLHEEQIKLYKSEISKNKELARKTKTEIEKNIIEMEKNSPVKEELEKLIKQKKAQQDELKSLKTEKDHILCKIDKFDQDCKEIKSVFTNHDKNRKTLNQLKNELDNSLSKIEDLKNKTLALEQENKKLKENTLINKNLIEQIDALKSENQIMKTQLIDLENLSNRINELKKEKQKLVEENNQSKEKNLLVKSNLGNGSFSVQVSSELGGIHQFSKIGDFSKAEMLNCQAISYEIDEICPERKGPLLLKVFQANIKKYLDERLDNREYKKSKPEYIFIP